MARQLQCQNDQRGEIVRVEPGLTLLQPYASLQEQEPSEHYQQRQYQQSQYGGGCSNGLDETLCIIRVRRNIDNPNLANTYNPRAGRKDFHCLPSQMIVIASAYRVSREDAKRLKHNRGDEFGVFTPSHTYRELPRCLWLELPRCLWCG